MSDEQRSRAGLVFDDRYLQHNPGLKPYAGPGGTFPWVEPELHWSNHRLVQRAKHLIDLSGVGKHLERIEPRFATEEEVAAYHTPGYIARVERICREGGGDVGEGAPVGPGSYEVALLAVGGALAAVDAVATGRVQRAFALLRPPGHHAVSDKGMGFCVFNNAVLAAMHARNEHGLERVMILDWDVHHGNGTQDAFYNDPNVLFISIHQENLYPAGSGLLEQDGEGDGKGFTVNIPLPPGSGDAAYLAAFERVILPIVDQFQPDLILISAGQDASIMDSLGRMCVTTEGYRRMTSLMINRAVRHAGGRLVVLQEGGYSEVYGPFAVLATVETLAGAHSELPEPLNHERIRAQAHHSEVGASARQALDAAVQHHAGRWEALREQLATVER